MFRLIVSAQIPTVGFDPTIQDFGTCMAIDCTLKPAIASGALPCARMFSRSPMPPRSRKKGSSAWPAHTLPPPFSVFTPW